MAHALGAGRTTRATPTLIDAAIASLDGCGEVGEDGDAEDGDADGGDADGGDGDRGDGAVERQDQVEPAFDTGTVRETTATATRDMTVGAPDLASHALRAALDDECHLFVHAILVGEGTRALPCGVHAGRETKEGRRFAGGVDHLRSPVAAQRAPRPRRASG